MSDSLIIRLNQLLSSLHLPIPLEYPTDLTPSLLLAILESLLGTRLPLSPTLRHTASLSKSADSFTAKLQCMKIFLGVLESDVLQKDVGLSRIDPRRLATGEWDETVFVGELLCWIGDVVHPQQSGIRQGHLDDLQASGEETDGHRTASPSTLTTVTRHTNLSMAESNTSINDTAFSESYAHSDSVVSIALPQATSSPRVSPFARCIHEVQSPSFILSPSSPFHRSVPGAEDMTSDQSLTPVQVPVRHDGYIEPVDQDWEIASFESSYSISRNQSRSWINNSRAKYQSKDEVSSEPIPVTLMIVTDAVHHSVPEPTCTHYFPSQRACAPPRAASRSWGRRRLML